MNEPQDWFYLGLRRLGVHHANLNDHRYSQLHVINDPNAHMAVCITQLNLFFFTRMPFVSC